ncbi:MAG: hypothetical protein Q6367_000450 [Candidatus Freyarchaeota archaeon]
MATSADLKTESTHFNNTLEELQFSSGLDIVITDMDGNIKASKLRYGRVEGIGSIILEGLEKNKKISETFSTDRIEDFIVHGKKGYTVVKITESNIFVISGLKEHQLGLALYKLRQIAGNV